jgi:hypothetical protein
MNFLVKVGQFLTVGIAWKRVKKAVKRGFDGIHHFLLTGNIDQHSASARSSFENRFA